MCSINQDALCSVCSVVLITKNAQQLCCVCVVVLITKNVEQLCCVCSVVLITKNVQYNCCVAKVQSQLVVVTATVCLKFMMQNLHIYFSALPVFPTAFFIFPATFFHPRHVFHCPIMLSSPPSFHCPIALSSPPHIPHFSLPRHSFHLAISMYNINITI